MHFSLTSKTQKACLIRSLLLMWIAVTAVVLVFAMTPAIAADQPQSGTGAAEQQTADAPPLGKPTEPFAKVGDDMIALADYRIRFAAEQKKRYYHAKVPEALVAKLQREVGDTLINRLLVVQEAKRRKVEPDAAKLKQMYDTTVASYDQRFGSDENYQKDRDKMMAIIRERISEELIAERLEADVRGSVSDPDEDTLRQFYKENIDLFTQPGQYRLSLILLGLDPSVGPKVVMDTMEEAKGLVEALRAGKADFAAMAEAISSDPSAAQGGDMGYRHAGMLAPSVEEVLSKMSVGDISDPTRVLEGISIFRLDDRTPSNVQPFETVRERALGLWQRLKRDQAWEELLASVRKKTPIEVFDDFYLPLPEADQAAGAGKN